METQTEEAPKEDQQQASSPHARRIIIRYQDGYRNANACLIISPFLIFFGLAGGFIQFLMILIPAPPGSRGVALFAAITSAATTVIGFYIVAKIISTLAHILRSNLDSTIHSSPLLNAAEKQELIVSDQRDH